MLSQEVELVTLGQTLVDRFKAVGRSKVFDMIGTVFALLSVVLVTVSLCQLMCSTIFWLVRSEQSSFKFAISRSRGSNTAFRLDQYESDDLLRFGNHHESLVVRSREILPFIKNSHLRSIHRIYLSGRI